MIQINCKARIRIRFRMIQINYKLRMRICFRMIQINCKSRIWISFRMIQINYKLRIQIRFRMIKINCKSRIGISFRMIQINYKLRIRIHFRMIRINYKLKIRIRLRMIWINYKLRIRILSTCLLLHLLECIYLTYLAQLGPQQYWWLGGSPGWGQRISIDMPPYIFSSHLMPSNHRNMTSKIILVECSTLTLIRSVLYRLVHFFKLFLNTDALSKKNLK